MRVSLLILGALLWWFKPAAAQSKAEFVAAERAASALNADTRAVGCAPATALRDLEWNNVRALISTNAVLWHDRSQSNGAYEVPKGSGLSSMYGGSIWMGGRSPDGQLKLAAMRYGSSGSDYWPGPLTTDGAAETNELVCQEYDRFERTLRLDAIRHRQYFDCINDPDCDLADLNLTDYVIPSYFFTYPAQGNVALGQDFYLAPFLDYNGDAIYDPSAGDYPWYDFLSEINCAERRREDQVPAGRSARRGVRLKSTAPNAAAKTKCHSSAMKPIFGFSTTRATSTPNRKVSPLAWKSVRRPSPSRPTTRSTT